MLMIQVQGPLFPKVRSLLQCYANFPINTTLRAVKGETDACQVCEVQDKEAH